MHILKACLRHGVRKIIFPSSGTVYGPWRGKPFEESDSTSPQTPYAAAKLKVEEYLRRYESKGLAYAVLRPGSAYGPGQNPLSGAGAAAAFLYQCLNGRPLHIYGRGEVVRDYTFSRDIVLCAVQSMAMAGSQIFNVSTGAGTSLLALSELCFRLTGQTVPVEFLAPRASDLNSIILDNSLERSLFGVRPTPLQEGLELTLRWLKSRRLE
jgi:UDP-glucose 4-epimerase